MKTLSQLLTTGVLVLWCGCGVTDDCGRSEMVSHYSSFVTISNDSAYFVFSTHITYLYDACRGSNGGQTDGPSSFDLYVFDLKNRVKTKSVYENQSAWYLENDQVYSYGNYSIMYSLANNYSYVISDNEGKPVLGVAYTGNTLDSMAVFY